jgi:predicted AAA+ superfamily ATPase
MSELLKWKGKSNRKPLLLEGARQVGKTYLPKISIRFSLKNTRLDNDLQNISLFNIFLCEQLLDVSSEKCVK